MRFFDVIEKKQVEARAFVIAWIIGCIFYFMEYVIRSSPAVMIKELSVFFNITDLQVSSVLGTYYYTYSVTSLIAGVALDRYGGKFAITAGAGVLALGCVLFSIPQVLVGDFGRLFQGAGSAFAFTGCVYLASHGFDAGKIATAIGFTQCVGMLGGSAGQFISGPLIQQGLSLKVFWLVIACICGVIAVMIFFITPSENKINADNHASVGLLIPYKIVFSNLQSYLSGLISGLLFAPTTIFAMTWGIAFFQQDRLVSYQEAVIVCSMVPLGWVIGCPLLGWISDRIGQRKPVLASGILVMILSFSQLIFYPKLFAAPVSMLIFGLASGAAMIPYTIIKEANPDTVKGSATGGINFLTFSVTALLAPVFSSYFGKTLPLTSDHASHFIDAGIFFLAILGLAFLLSLVIKETGAKGQRI